MARKRKKSTVGTLITVVLLIGFASAIFNSGKQNTADDIQKNLTPLASKENDTPLALQSVWYKQEKEGEGAIYACFNRAIGRTEIDGLRAIYGVSYIVHTKNNQQKNSGQAQDIVPINSLSENGKEINRCYYLLSQSSYRKNHSSYYLRENLARVELLRKENIAFIEVALYKKRELVEKKIFYDFEL